jgi:cobalamin biosynthesis Mg chelatase CobN
VFYSKLNSTPAALEGLSTRARIASSVATQNAQLAAQTAQQAAQTAAKSAAKAAQAAAQSAAADAGSAAQSAAHEMGRSVRGGVDSARGWAAPQLESAADYTTDTVAPKIAEALRSTARQVRPASARRRSALAWSLLAVGAIAAVGAVAAVAIVRQKYKAAMEADSESDLMDIEDKDEPGGTATTPQAGAVAGV